MISVVAKVSYGKIFLGSKKISPPDRNKTTNYCDWPHNTGWPISGNTFEKYRAFSTSKNVTLLLINYAFYDFSG